MARLHLLEQPARGLSAVPVEQLADEMPAQFDVVTCMEMLEHVTGPGVGGRRLRHLVKTGRTGVLLDRQPQSQVLSVRDRRCRYVLRLLPRGTHDYAIHQAVELSRAGYARAGLDTRDITGLTYSPLSGVYRLDPRDVDVNYMIATVTRSLRENRRVPCCSTSTAPSLTPPPTSLMRLNQTLLRFRRAAALRNHPPGRISHGGIRGADRAGLRRMSRDQPGFEQRRQYLLDVSPPTCVADRFSSRHGPGTGTP